MVEGGPGDPSAGWATKSTVVTSTSTLGAHRLIRCRRPAVPLVTEATMATVATQGH